MAIKRYYATKDNSITNAYKMDFRTIATSSNMGLADVIEVFAIRGQVGTSSLEAMRAIIQFDIDSISSDRTAGDIPSSGSVNFFLRLYNAPHAYSLPRNYSMSISALSQSWNEGTGLDLEEFSDSGSSNWVDANSNSQWVDADGNASSGGSTHSAPIYHFSFGEVGTEDILLDVTSQVEEWVAGSTPSGEPKVMMDFW